jgi:cell division protein FtsB
MRKLERHLAPYGDKRPLLDEIERLENELACEKARGELHLWRIDRLKECVRQAEAETFHVNNERLKLNIALDKLTRENIELFNEIQQIQMGKFRPFVDRIKNDMADSLSACTYPVSEIPAQAFSVTIRTRHMSYAGHEGEYWGVMREKILDVISRDLASCISQYLAQQFEEKFSAAGL